MLAPLIVENPIGSELKLKRMVRLPLNNTLHTDSARTLGFHIGDLLRGAGGGER